MRDDLENLKGLDDVEDEEFIRLRVVRGIRLGRSCDTCGMGRGDRECELLSNGGREARRGYVKAGVNCWRPSGVVMVMDEVEV